MKKRLIICCDGTWNDLEMRYITNVGRLVQAILPKGKSGSSDIAQVVYYDDGVGASSDGLDRAMEGMFGHGLDRIIYEAYRFICQNYEKGDEICLFGFSRGAFSVRSIAGMIGRVGLVPRAQSKHIPGALKAYRSRSAKKCEDFMELAKAVTVKIDLLGCWDTVGALGVPDKLPFIPIDNISRKRYQFHDTKVGAGVKRAVHAVAIDEQRKEFSATLMERGANAPSAQKISQKWFPGDHGSVGGGTWEKRGLSNRCLKWLIEESKKLGQEVKVDWKRLHDKGIEDHSIFFSRVKKFYYGTKWRAMPDGLVDWDDIDTSAQLRWCEDANYRPSWLKKRFATQLNALTLSRTRKLRTNIQTLNINQRTFAKVEAREKHNNIKVEVKRGQKFRIEVSRLQVWKDGDLDPCDILGWNALKDSNGAKSPYEDGEKVDLSSLKARLIKRASSKKQVPEADWFELVAQIGGEEHIDLGITSPASEIEPFATTFIARADGELFLSANDLASKIFIIDKYDNNTGYVWVSIKRLS